MHRIALSFAVILLFAQNADSQFFDVSRILQHYEHAIVRIEADDGFGSGFFVSGDGWILTNRHVVSDEENYPNDRIRVRLRNGKVYSKQQIKRSYSSDLALIKISYHPRITIPIYSHSLEPLRGKPVATIGHPKGENWSVTAGNISHVDPDQSALDKSEYGRHGEILNHSVDINPGNSGGPLINETGHVVGVVAASLFLSQNLNIAVNADAIRQFLREHNVSFSTESSLPIDISDCQRILDHYSRGMKLLSDEKEEFIRKQESFSEYMRKQEKKLESDRRQLLEDKDFMNRAAGIRRELDRRASTVSQAERNVSERENALSRRETALQSRIREFEREKELSRYMYPKRFSLELHSAFSFHTGEDQSFSYFGRIGAALLYRIGVDTRSYASQDNPCDRIGIGAGYVEVLDSELQSVHAIRDLVAILDIDERVRFSVGRVWSDSDTWNYGHYPWIINVTYYLSRYGYPIGLTVGSLSTERFTHTGFTVGLTAGVGLNMLRI